MSTEQITAAALLTGDVLATGERVTRVDVFTAHVHGLLNGTWIEWTTEDGMKDCAPAYSRVYVLR